MCRFIGVVGLVFKRCKREISFALWMWFEILEWVFLNLYLLFKVWSNLCENPLMFIAPTHDFVSSSLIFQCSHSFKNPNEKSFRFEMHFLLNTKTQKTCDKMFDFSWFQKKIENFKMNVQNSSWTLSTLFLMYHENIWIFF